MGSEFVLCGNPPPFAGDLEPCPLQHGHQGDHVYWLQTQPDRRRGRNGVLIYSAPREGKLEKLMHATFDGAVTAEEVCALLVLRDIVARERGG